MPTWDSSPQDGRLTIGVFAERAGPVVIGLTDRHIDVYHDGRDLSICNRCAALQPVLITHRPFPLSGRCQTCGAAGRYDGWAGHGPNARRPAGDHRGGVSPGALSRSGLRDSPPGRLVEAAGGAWGV